MKKLGRFIRHLIFGVIWSGVVSFFIYYRLKTNGDGSVAHLFCGIFLGTVFYLLTTLWLDWKAEHSVTFTKDLLGHMIAVKVIYPFLAALTGSFVGTVIAQCLIDGVGK